jgi:hypothetical protein
MGITDFAKGTTAPVKVDEDIASIKVGSRTIEVNPAQIKEDAQRAAEEATQININAPEALDYLASAQRFRNDSLGAYNNALQKGRTRLTDAQRYLDTGDSVYNDIENLIQFDAAANPALRDSKRAAMLRFAEQVIHR